VRHTTNCCWIVLAIAVTSTGGCSQGEKKIADKGGDDGIAKWSSDPALLASLEAPIEFEGYVVRPPKGHTRTDPPGAPPGARMVAWAGGRRKDGTAAVFLVMVGTPPKSERIPPLEEALQSMLQGTRRIYSKDWTQEATESGEINGLKFVRARWKGVNVAKGAKMHGFTYVAIDGLKVIQISGQELEPHHENGLKIAEAAALSFQRK
jgi:hypothetical protein